MQDKQWPLCLVHGTVEQTLHAFLSVAPLHEIEAHGMKLRSEVALLHAKEESIELGQGEEMLFGGLVVEGLLLRGAFGLCDLGLVLCVEIFSDHAFVRSSCIEMLEKLPHREKRLTTSVFIV